MCFTHKKQEIQRPQGGEEFSMLRESEDNTDRLQKQLEY